MKLFRVINERDGEVTKEPSRVTTQIVREEIMYVADSIETVWETLSSLRHDSERRVVAVIEEWSTVIIL